MENIKFFNLIVIYLGRYVREIDVCVGEIC